MADPVDLRPKTDRTNALRQRRYRKRRRRSAVTVSVTQATPAVTPKLTAPRNGVTSAVAFLAAGALTSVSGYFGIVGLTSVFAAAAIPVTAMAAVLEGSKLVAAAWLARNWRTAPVLLRAPLLLEIVALTTLTAIGTFGFLTRAHLEHHVSAAAAIDAQAAPISHRITIAASALADIDDRIRLVDELVRSAAVRGRINTATGVLADQARSRAALVEQRRLAAERLLSLKVAQAGVEAQRARIAIEDGPATYLARLFGTSDPELMVRLIAALLVLTIDPLALLLTIAATRGSRS